MGTCRDEGLSQTTECTLLNSDVVNEYVKMRSDAVGDLQAAEQAMVEAMAEVAEELSLDPRG